MNLIEGRECGDCTVCCEVLSIDDNALKKPAGDRCKHVTDKGCGIYHSRPSVCQQWFCMWRWFPFAERVRPDKSNILISFEYRPELNKEVMVARDISKNGTAFAQPGFEHIINSMLAKNIEVWCHRDGHPLFKSSPNNPIPFEDTKDLSIKITEISFPQGEIKFP